MAKRIGETLGEEEEEKEEEKKEKEKEEEVLENDPYVTILLTLKLHVESETQMNDLNSPKAMANI